MTESAQTPSYKLFSSRAVAVGTFLGGPLATGLMLRRNFHNLGQKTKGNRALAVGALFTLALLGVVALLPEHIVHSNPFSLIPTVYTALTFQWMKVYQGAVLQKHQAAGGTLFSGWKTAGISLGSFFASFLVIAGFAMTFDPGFFSSARYEAAYREFQAHETRAMEFYQITEREGSTVKEAVKFLDEEGLPAWQECQRLVKEMQQDEHASEELKDHIKMLRNYTDLRLESFRIQRQILSGEGDLPKLREQLGSLQSKLEKMLE